MVRAVRANQWAISQGQLSPEDLDLQTRKTFRHTAHCLYDLYHHLRTPAEFQRLVDFTPNIDEIIRCSQAGFDGRLVVGVHMSNFDFVMQQAARRGLQAQALSFPDPGGGYQWQNDLRRQSGLEITPASLNSIRSAVKRLKSGGVVLTGIDRPERNPHYHPKFFGYPSNLPVFYVQLAIMAEVPVVVVSIIMDEEGIYHIEASQPITMVKSADHRAEILVNAERILEVAAGYIRRAPHQWSMFYPVWPGIMEKVA